MYLLSQLWLYLLLACLAGLALGLLLNRICQQRRHAAQLDALQAQHREARVRSDAALVDLRGEHALALEAAGADRAALQTTYESRITLFNTETSRTVQLTDELAALQARHAALEETHRSALAERAEVAKEAYDALIDTQAERDAARATAAETEAELTRERQAAVLAAGVAAAAALSARQTATQAEHAAHQQADAIAALETELAALRNQRTALESDLTALQGTHSTALSAHDGALVKAQAELDAARQTASATEAECAACAAQAERAAQQHADATAAFETELATLRAAAAVHDAEASRQAARATEVEAELSRERQAALLAAGVAAAAALSSQQSHQHALAALEQQRTDLVAQRDRRIAELQALLADQEAAWQGAERQVHALRDAQAAGQSAAQLREQAIQQELALTQTRTQELEAELRGLRLTLAENDEQLATLGARLQTERDQQQAAQARIAELAALVPPPAPEVPVVVRPAVSAAATITSAELERLVLAAGAGQQPAPVEIDHQRPDDLKIIDGIGPVNERWLHAHGVRYFWQIASWSPAELAWVANHLPNFGSRVYRENWIAQSAKLAAQQPVR